MVSFKLTHELPSSINNNNKNGFYNNYDTFGNPVSLPPAAKHTRRLNFSVTPSWEDLANKIDQLFFIPVYNVAITYFDTEGDEITLSTEEEYIAFALSRDFKKNDVNILGVKDLKILRDAVRGPSLGGYNYQPASYLAPPLPYSPVLAPAKPVAVVASRSTTRCCRMRTSRSRSRSRSPSVQRRSRSRSRSPLYMGIQDRRCRSRSPRSRCPTANQSPSPRSRCPTPPELRPVSPMESHAMYDPSSPINVPLMAPPSPPPALWRPAPAFSSRAPSPAPSSLVNIDEDHQLQEAADSEVARGLKALLKILAPDASVNASEETLRKLIRVLAE